MQNRIKHRLPLILTVLIMVFIFMQSALPADLSRQESGMIVGILVKFLHLDAEILSFVVRKCAHFTEYMALGMSTFATVREYLLEKGGGPGGHEPEAGAPFERNSGALLSRRAAGDPGGAMMPAWVIGTVYAVTDEVHQYFVPGRSCEVRDMFIDSCGVTVGVLIIFMIIRWRCRRGRISSTPPDLK